MNALISYKHAAIRKNSVSKELTLIKEMHQKNVCFIIIGILKMFDLNLNHIFVLNAIMF